MTISFQTRQEEPLATSNTTVYTCASTNSAGHVVSALASNTTTSAIDLTVYIVQDGDSEVDTNKYIPVFSVPPNEGVKIYPLLGEQIGPGDSIRMKASATGLNVRLSIKENST
jgi:hypothetical protein